MIPSTSILRKAVCISRICVCFYNAALPIGTPGDPFVSDVVGIGVGIVCDVPASNSKTKRCMKSKIDRCNTGTSFDIKKSKVKFTRSLGNAGTENVPYIVTG